MQLTKNLRFCFAVILIVASMGVSSAARAEKHSDSKSVDASLIFMLTASLDAAINGKNAICVSDIMTLPGPHGWRVPAPDYSDSAYSDYVKANDAALATIDSYKEAFLAKCRVYGPADPARSSYLYNREGDQVLEMKNLLQRQRDDGMPIVSMP